MEEHSTENITLKNHSTNNITSENLLSYDQLSTFADLFEYVKRTSYDEIMATQRGNIEPQEVLFKLFAKLGLFKGLLKLTPCLGNFNLGNVYPEIDVYKLLLENLSHGGDSADMVLSSGKNIYVITSKNKANISVTELDIGNIYLHHQQFYPKKKLKIIVVIKDIIKIPAPSSQKYNDLIYKVYNQIDLKKAYDKFMKKYIDVNVKSLYRGTHLKPRFHQELTVKKTLDVFKKYKTCVWGHIPRSGKSYIMATLIHKLAARNYLCITTAPNETIDQYIKLLSDHVEFINWTISDLRKTVKKPSTPNNIVIVSLQKLKIQLLKKELKWLYDMSYDLVFIDEAHHGAANTYTTKILDQVTTIKQIYITATYNKPANFYNVKPEQIITWDLEDIRLAAKADITTLSEKHGGHVREITIDPADYQKYPTLHMLSYDFTEDVRQKILTLIEDPSNEDYGFSYDSVLMLKQDELGNYLESFKDPERVHLLTQSIFGPADPVSINKSLLENARQLAIHHNSRWFSLERPLMILVIMPIGKGGDITTRLKAYKKFLEQNNYLKDFVIEYTTSVKKTIDDAHHKALNMRKKGYVILTGRKGLLGITYEHCDLVVCLTELHGDQKWQTMFRCMTEAPDKTIGMFLDVSLESSIKTLLEYAISLSERKKGDLSKIIRYIYAQRLITLHNSQWFNDYFEHHDELADLIVQKSLDVLSSNNSFSTLIKAMTMLKFNISSELFQVVKQTFHGFNKKATKKLKETLPDGIVEVKQIEVEVKGDEVKSDATGGVNSEQQLDQKQEDNQQLEQQHEPQSEPEPSIDLVNDIFKYIVPLVCLLTYNQEIYDFKEICNCVLGDKNLKAILLASIKTWWKDTESDKALDVIMKIYDMFLSQNEIFISLVNFIKQGLKTNLGDLDTLSKLIDEYLTPHENEKRQNAEVSTPYGLRQEMLDSVEKYTTIFSGVKDSDDLRYPRIFEPCCGKGGFLIDVIDRLKKGLRKYHPDDSELYQVIVEDCLYFADINPLNIFICKLLIDPAGKYKLNYYLGDTLDLNVVKKFGDKFDLVIGNPPYNASNSVGTGTPIWQHFTRKALTEWLNLNGYLCYVHPSGWRKPETKNIKFKGLFKQMTQDNQMLYLEIHGLKDGQKTFNCGTRYDWYLIQKGQPQLETVIIDELGRKHSINLCNLTHLPNYNFDLSRQLCSGVVKCPIIYNTSSYGSCCRNVKAKETLEFKYPLIHAITKKEIRYMYSNVNNKGHFGISKVIFGDSGLNDAIIDLDGKYGMTEHAMAIQVIDQAEAEKIKKALLSTRFKDFIKSQMFSNFQIDWRVFGTMSQDWYKEFI